MASALDNGAALKIQRAKGHVAQLSVALKEFNEADPYRIAVGRYPDRLNQFGMFLKVKAQIPQAVALIIGDAIHNLHTALDHSICAAIRRKGAAVSRNAQFPFAKSGETLEKTISVRQVHSAAPKVADVIRGLKPYPGANDELCALHMLDILDKHELILPLAQFTRMHATFTISQDITTPVSITVPSPVIYFEADELIDGMEVAGPVEIVADDGEGDNDFKATLEIAFGRGPFHRKSVIPTLDQVTQLVEEVVGLIKAASLT